MKHSRGGSYSQYADYSKLSFFFLSFFLSLLLSPWTEGKYETLSDNISSAALLADVQYRQPPGLLIRIARKSILGRAWGLLTLTNMQTLRTLKTCSSDVALKQITLTNILEHKDGRQADSVNKRPRRGGDVKEGTAAQPVPLLSLKEGWKDSALFLYLHHP